MGKNIFDFRYDFAELFEFFVKISRGYHTPASQSPRGIIPRWVTQDTRGVSLKFLNCLHRPLKGQCHKNKCGIIFYYSLGYIFHFCTIVLGWNFILTPRGIIPWGVSFLEPKVRITPRNLNQNKKYFNPLVSAPDRFKWWKKLEVENLVRLSL